MSGIGAIQFNLFNIMLIIGLFWLYNNCFFGTCLNTIFFKIFIVFLFKENRIEASEGNQKSPIITVMCK